MNLAEDVILEFGKTLIEFCPCADVRRLITEVEVRGWDNSKGKAVVGSAVIDDIDGKGGKIVKENFGDQKEIRIDPTVHDIKRAEELAKNILTQNARKYITGAGMARGDTEIRARSIIKVNGVGKKFSNKYYIQCTRHVLNANGYTTYFYFTTYIGTEGAKGIGGSDASERVVFEEPKRKEQGIVAGGAGKDEDKAEKEKQPKISNLKWMKNGKQVTKALVGDKVKMTADVKDIDDGKWAKITIYEKDYDNENDYIGRKSAQVKNSKIEFEWEVEYHEDTDDVNSAQEQEEKGYTLPEYIFVIDAKSPEVKSGDSPVLEVKGWIKTKLINEGNSEVFANTEFILRYPDGSEEEGTTDESGYIEKKNLKLGKYYIKLK